MGWNNKVTAQRCGLTPDTLTRYKKGERVPNGEKLAKLAMGLKIYDIRKWFSEENLSGEDL